MENDGGGENDGGDCAGSSAKRQLVCHSRVYWTKSRRFTVSLKAGEDTQDGVHNSTLRAFELLSEFGCTTLVCELILQLLLHIHRRTRILRKMIEGMSSNWLWT
jgi:hypothetical protein